MDKLDLRVQKTYKSVIEGFEVLLHEKEFEKISVTEICSSAMIRRPTFYSHFLDKYDFLTFFIKHKMNIIFNHASQNLSGEGDDFLILVFEQLVNQSDNVLNLIFSIQMNPDVMFELVSVQEYGQDMLKTYANVDENSSNNAMVNEYKEKMIMGITIQSVHWYKNNKEKISREEMVKLYKQTLKKMR